MTIEHPRFRAAAIQATPAYLDLDAGVDKTVDLIKEAAAHGAKLVVFPETWLPGYPYWAWLGSAAWGMQWVQRYSDHSFVVGSAQEQRLAAAARDNDVHVVIGVSERDGASLYMGQLILDNTGRRIAARRKVKPTYIERIVFGEGDGEDLAVHDTAIGRLGALCCWEHLQPLTKFAMYSMNEQVHAASWPSHSLYPAAFALGRELNAAATQMYAAEGGCFVISASMPVSPAMIDLLCDTEDKRALLLPGGGNSMIFGPDGARLAEYLPPDAEGILYADIDLSMISLAKAATDPAGHYSRPDITRLVFNQARVDAVESPTAVDREPPRSREPVLTIDGLEPGAFAATDIPAPAV